MKKSIKTIATECLDYKTRVVRRFSSDKLRTLCIRENWFTRGDNKAYMEMFEFVDERKYITDWDIETIARYIFQYSNLDEELETYGVSKNEFISNMMFKICNECLITIIKDCGVPEE